MNPWMLVLAVVLFGAGLISGVKLEADHRDASELVIARAEAAAYHSGVNAAKALGVKLGSRRAKTRIVYRTLKGESDELGKTPEYNAVACLPSDGLRIANDALQRRSSAGERR